MKLTIVLLCFLLPYSWLLPVPPSSARAWALRKKAGRSYAPMYGFPDQRNDVTDILKAWSDAASVNGQALGHNKPWAAIQRRKDKQLRIFARNRRNEQREFDFNEGGFVEVRMFDVRMMNGRRDDWRSPLAPR